MNFYVDKQSGGFASTLAAYGWAEIVARIAARHFGEEGYTLRLQDCGTYLLIALSPSLTKADFVNFPDPIQPAPILRTKKNQSTLPDPSAYWQFDYEKGKTANEVYFAFRKANKDATPDQMPPPPDPYWDIYRAINPGGLPGYNNLLKAWHTAAQADQGALLGLLFDLFSSFPNDLDGVWMVWKALDKEHGWKISAGATALQLYNPDQGMGVNRVKIATIARGNVDNFWLLEVLKATGFFGGAITRLVKGGKDRKTYILAPQDIDYADHRAIMGRFREAMQVSRLSITSDILAAVLYSEALISYAEQRVSFKDMLLKKRRPRNLVSGFHTAFYKSLGNSPATMNLAFIGLPSWISAADNASLQAAKEALDELKRLTYGLEENTGDGYNLLSALRDFVSGGELNRFFDFTTAYASYWMGRRERGKYAHQLSIQFIETAILGSQEE